MTACCALLALTLLAACAPLRPTETAWGPAYALAQAEQAAGPALWANTRRAAAVWVGTDEAGVHQDARARARGALPASAALPRGSSPPVDPRVLRAAGDPLHQVWR
ncbi:MAG: hypothetical protein ACUVSX_11165, partial [Aggregatilineales bacterium]